MRFGIVALIFSLTFGARCIAQTNSAMLAQAFDSLGKSQVQNEIFIPDHVNPRVVVLYAHGASESLSLISFAGGVAHTEWHLARLPYFMSVIDPTNLTVERSDNGIMILLHGCAPHLCGGQGLAGALVYSANQKQLYTVSASWESPPALTKYQYSLQGSAVTKLAITRLLKKMLQEEGYK
jgi:hypothetical protein